MTDLISRLGEARKQIQIAGEKLDDERLVEELEDAEAIIEAVEGDLADAVESGDLELTLDAEQDPEELREFVERAEAGEFDPVDPGLEAAVRIARALLDDRDGDADP